MSDKMLPGDIERASMEIIAGELAQRGLVIPPEREEVVKRVIHTTADFDFAQNLRFSEQAVELGEDEQNRDEDFGYWCRPVRR